MKWCVAVGNPFDGITIYGPFDSSDAADKWAEELNNVGGDWWIIVLTDPNLS